jgi:4'-phosphopantetheinyl transferase
MLRPSDVHLWRLPQKRDCLDSMRRDGLSLLSPTEKRRYYGMKHPAPADQYLLGRILMRRVLSQYLSIDPAELNFTESANGKPELSGQSVTPISFNLSHSSRETILAVSGATAIGIDIETYARANAAYRIAQRFFSAEERDRLEVIGELRAAHALMLWALKESIVKANGDTVWDGLANVSLALEGRRISWQTPPGRDGSRWKLAGGEFNKDYILAVAIELPARITVQPLKIEISSLGASVRDKIVFEPEFSM